MSVPSCEIILERESGVYFAGEVVRGTVRLQTSGDINTKGARITYTGQAYSEYTHYRSNADGGNITYTASYVYDTHQATMWGNYFKTSTIDKAGNEAIFGRGGGDGVIYIPCNNDEQLNLVLQVMNYDTLKGDEILGETTVKLIELLNNGAAQSFPLTRLGKPEKGELAMSARIVPLKASSFSARAPTVGPPGYDSVCELRVHKATGLRNANFITKNNVFVQAYRALEAMYERGRNLPSPDKNIILPAGTMEFPFAFPIRPDAPHSAELAGDLAYIRYTLEVEIEKPAGAGVLSRLPAAVRAINVIAANNKPPPELLHPITYDPDKPQTVASWCCMNYCCCVVRCCPCLFGNLEMKATLGRQVYAPGEVLDLRGSVKNNTSSQVVVNVVLTCMVWMRLGKGVANFQDSLRNDTLQKYTIDPNASWEYDGAAHDLRVPAVAPSFFGAPGMGTANEDPVLYTYYIGFAVGTGVSSIPCSMSIPLMISAVPPLPEAQSAAQRENRAPIKVNQRAGRTAVPTAQPTSAPTNAAAAAVGTETGQRGMVVPAGPLATVTRKDASGLPFVCATYQPQVQLFVSGQTSRPYSNELAHGAPSPDTPASAQGYVRVVAVTALPAEEASLLGAEAPAPFRKLQSAGDAYRA